jgi:flagellum-specific peptidoglycan hydrolase FlgJ
MHSAGKPRWQQVTAVVSLSAGGAITGFSFVPRAAPDITSPTSMPIRLLALKQSARPAPADDAMLRSAIVNVANYYLRMAEGRTPAEMEAIIWQHDSTDGVDHGASCAAFASLTLELAAQVVGHQSWVTGGTSYPWPLQEWADVRVDPNPASLGITSVLQDAEAHHRWHPLGDGYEPLPGDWVLFNGHVEVVTKYVGGLLHTVGGDSLPNFSVNAHEYRDPLGAQGVVGFVNNGELPGTAAQTPRTRDHASGGHQARDQAASGRAAIPGASAAGSPEPAPTRPPGDAGIPATPAPAPSPRQVTQAERRQPGRGQERASRASQRPDQPGSGQAVTADVPGTGLSAPTATPQAATPQAATPPAATPGAAAIPGLPAATRSPSVGSAAPSTAPYSRHHSSPAAAPVNDANTEQAFIGQVAPGAVAAQRTYGVPAAVTIAQAIDESGWGRSHLAANDHNLFGIKGTGPAGSDPQPTQEYDNGRLVTRTAAFRVYHDVAQSIDDHGKLLATSEYYRQPMADRQDPNAFAAALTGVYATDPDYGAKLIRLMRRYNLYHYDIAAPAATPHAAKPHAAKPHAAAPGGAAIPGLPHTAPAPPVSTSPPAPAPAPPAAGTQSAASRPLPRVRPSTPAGSAKRAPAPLNQPARRIASRSARTSTSQYQQHIPLSVRNAFIAMASVPLIREEPLYRDVASHSGIRWELLAACDWMQCEAQPRYSPVHGEKLGTVNPDGTIYRTKSEALEQCVDDLVELAWTVYRIDLTARADLSVRDLANAFAAFRWGGLLKLHHTSAMEFPYSVAGLTSQHINMRWPGIDEPDAPDKPGGRFRMPFGAVPIVLGLNYRATV